MCEKTRRGQLAFWVSLKDAGDGGDPRLLRNSSALEALPYFCTTANLQSAVVYLSQELQGLGLGCPLIETEGQHVNLVALVNALWEVTQLYRSSVRDTSVLQDQRRRDTVDMNHFQNSIKDLRGEVDEKERLVCEAQEKERQAASHSKTLAAKLKAEKDEVRRLTSVMQQREGHHQHELKKKEMENLRLQDRLHRLVSGGRASESRQPSFSLSSTLSRANRSRAKWKTEASSVRHEEELYKRVLAHYEAWIGQVNEENGQLKSSLLRISSSVSKAVEKYSKQVDMVPELPDGDMNSSTTSSTFSMDSLDDLAVNMEFPAYRDRLQQAFDQNMRTMVLMLEEAAGARRNDNTASTEREKELKGELDDLRRQLKATREELGSHTYAVEKYDPEKATGRDASFLVEGQLVEEEEGLVKERQRLAREREMMEEERRSFAEATIRLNRERAAFEAEKGELLKEQFLQDLPATLEADLTLIGQDSCGSLSSGSIGEIFDSPQRMVALPNITSPTGNINYVPGSSLVLGPSRLSKQQQQHDSKKGRGSSRRL
ncbi:afadin- and alpha-actinin-binding protein B-like isoform X2 [Eriocheir sinensis]|uniref:afadin- and alpha-actinin-binding protein B-like isoform X2 n=1 Tax=Eriocheir sinensis TaxID=95602 RepID=UPI0021C60E25|nr:afadin- and alpha-actinin-binding protein B-like isoform X2 [Eriocheir sinensis]